MENRELKVVGNEEVQNHIEERNAFIKSIRGLGLNEVEKRALSGLTDADGKVTIPQDIQTKINEYKRELKSVKGYTRVENVITRSGTRVYEKLADMTPLASRAENSLIADAGSPKFETLSYSIQDYAGMLKISNELLEDTAENIMNHIAKFFAAKSVVTENLSIFGLLNTAYSTKSAIGAGSEVADVKKILNVTIDPALSPNAKIYTNQDGFQKLDTLVDANGNALLQVDVKDSTVRRFLGKEVVVFSNKNLPTTGTTTKKAPFIVGDMAEAITYFDRKKPEMMASNVGGDAFETNSTNVRLIERFDVKVFDKDALVYAEITV